MARKLIKRMSSIASKTTEPSIEDIVLSSENLESLLEEDGTFVEFFNAFLALPMFPIRLYYNPDVAYFEEFKQKLADSFIDSDSKKCSALQKYSFFKSNVDSRGLKIGYYVKFLSKSDGFDWVKKNRLLLFIKSELCAEYKMARILSANQTVYLMNILLDSRNMSKSAFLDEDSAPKYRTQRNPGKLPGLAEFLERRMVSSKGMDDENSSSFQHSFGSCGVSSDSSDDDDDEVEFSQIYSRRRGRNAGLCQMVTPMSDAETIETQKDIAIMGDDNNNTIDCYSRTTSTSPVDTASRDDVLVDDVVSRHSIGSSTATEAQQGIEFRSSEEATGTEQMAGTQSDKEISEQDGYVKVVSVFGASKQTYEDSVGMSSKDLALRKELENDERTCDGGIVDNLSSRETAAKDEVASDFENDCNLTDSKDNDSNPMKETIQIEINSEGASEMDEIKRNGVVYEVGEEHGLVLNNVKEDSSNADAEKHSQVAIVVEEAERKKTDEETGKGEARDSSMKAKHAKENEKQFLSCHRDLQMKRRGSDWTAVANEIVSGADDDFALPRRGSMPALKQDFFKNRVSSTSLDSDDLEAINSLLASDMRHLTKPVNETTMFTLFEDSDSEESNNADVSKRDVKKPIDISSKPGMDAFKYFLVDTPGEKLFLLWVEIERLKHASDNEKTNMIHEIRQRFFRSGSAYELSIETMKKWKLHSISQVEYKTLIGVQEKVLEPLRIYWCARFTVHQKIKHKSHSSDYISQDHLCTKSKCSIHQIEMTKVPQRPTTCFPHFKVSNADQNQAEVSVPGKQLKQPASQSHTTSSTVNREVLQPHSDGEVSRTKARIRSKSAYPRLINTNNPKDINLCHKQLQMLTTIEEGCGYDSHLNVTYKHNATDDEYKSNIRLFIRPVPPPHSKASTVAKSKPVRELKHHEDEKQHLLDSLVECLLHEKHSGNFFYSFLERSSNQLWLNCYQFWQLLQDYTEHFFADKFSPGLIKQKAGFLYSNFVVTDSLQSLNCDAALQKDVFKKLDPAYEELFDKIEEHALDILSQAFQLIFTEESDQYNQLTKNEKLRYLDVRTTLTKPKYQADVEKEEEKENDKEDFREKISTEEVNSPLPVSSDGVTFDSFIRNKVEVESFKEFLEGVNNKGLRDLLAWTEMENFRRSSRRHDQRNTIAKSVNTNWLTKDYFFGPISPATKEAQEKVRNMAGEDEIPERPPSPLILEAQKYVRARIERRWFIAFKETPEYLQKHKAPNVTEMVEDMIMKKRIQRSEAAWKILNSRWVSGSRDVVALRQVLMHPVKCLQFRRFLSLKGELMERNVHFWLEVQKYKDLCHRHVEDSIIKNKIQAIVDVFIKSSIPPDLQIDVPIEIAERLYEKATGRFIHQGPYLFREAQTTVFRIMFNYWKEFISFRGSIEENKFDQHLEELGKKHKAQVRAKKMIAERKRLAKSAFDKRRREREEHEREKERRKLFASRAESYTSMLYEHATSLISEDDEVPMQTKSFTFSKFTVEHELEALEQRMRDEGYTLDEITEGDVLTTLHSERKTSRKLSAHFSDDQRSSSGISLRRGKKTNDIFSKLHRKGSVAHEPIFEGSEKGIKEHGEDSSKQKLSVIAHHKNMNSHLLEKSMNRKKNFDAISVGKISSVTDLGKVSRPANVSLMPGPQRTNTPNSLTTKSLREFSKSPQGKPLAVPLPLIHVTNSVGKEQSIVSVQGSSNKPMSDTSRWSKSCVKKIEINRPKSRPMTNRKLKNESSSNESATDSIIADVIVC